MFCRSTVFDIVAVSRFKNSVPLTFDDVQRHGEQEFDLQHDKDGLMEYQTR